MATQYGYECWCSRNPGLDFIRHTVAEEGDTGLCGMPCYGDDVNIIVLTVRFGRFKHAPWTDSS